MIKHANLIDHLPVKQVLVNGWPKLPKVLARMDSSIAAETPEG
jgi:hypothetical protein